MLKLLSDLTGLLFAIPLLLFGGLLKLFGHITGAVPGTPTEDRGAKLLLVLVIVWYIVFFAILAGAPGPM